MPNRAAEAKTSSRLHARFTVPFFSIHEHVPERTKRRRNMYAYGTSMCKLAGDLPNLSMYAVREPSDQCSRQFVFG